LYVEQLRRWYQWFSKDQVLVVRSEDLYQEPLATLNRVIAFLELAPLVAIDAVVHNERPYAPMETGFRKTLVSAFRASNHELEELLGRRLGWE
ncbi:MAG: sulfotransferase domain-containing protein, partial [Chloroflexota bacterium]